MLRAVLAVIVSYIVMFLLIFAAFSSAYLILGADQAFKPKLFLASNRWIALSLVVNFVVAVIGGLICAAIAKGGKAPLALATVVFVVGLLLAVPAVMKQRANSKMARVSSTSNLEAMQKAYWPTWVPFTFPFVGAIGVLIGGRLKRRA